eukprot:366555-Chlamydomonas_euryale.AAC.34
MGSSNDVHRLFRELVQELPHSSTACRLMFFAYTDAPTRCTLNVRLQALHGPRPAHSKAPVSASTSARPHSSTWKTGARTWPSEPSHRIACTSESASGARLRRLTCWTSRFGIVQVWPCEDATLLAKVTQPITTARTDRTAKPQYSR